jgi:hypothetical protein
LLALLALSPARQNAKRFARIGKNARANFNESIGSADVLLRS